MQGFSQKIIVTILAIVMVFGPVFTSPEKASASDFSQLAGNVFVTALGCSGLLNKASSALSRLTDSLAGSLTGEVPVGDAGTHTTTDCLNGIAYTLAKIVLAKLTASSLNWINSGFNGSPTFVQDPGSFFKSIADEEVSTFTARI